MTTLQRTSHLLHTDDEAKMGRFPAERSMNERHAVATHASRMEDEDTLAGCEGESLVADRRAHLTPAQMVEQKLVSLLRGKGLLASHIQVAGLLKARN